MYAAVLDNGHDFDECRLDCFDDADDVDAVLVDKNVERDNSVDCNSRHLPKVF